MATRTLDLGDDGNVTDIDVSSEMKSSFLTYAYSVIYSRALPDARDGLKPVQRRILYQMGQMGLRPERGHVKSARVVGEVMGRLHPHGESAIYDALVRMAQPFSLRVPFVDGHGNFGSPDDGPAAMRYTECRLAPAAMAMLDGIDEEVVDFVPNYDGREVQPEVLPAAIPALLVNGATGIAVGMATNMAPHNLGEVIAAARHLLRHPGAGIETLMRHVPGPDLPTGGQIVGLDGVQEAYLSGRGSFKIRATAHIEQVTPRRRGIIVTEMPYNVGIERVIEKIKELHDAKRITGVAAVTDLSDGEHGTRLVVEVKSGFNPEAVLGDLYRLTPLEDSFTINAVALVDGAPATLGLKDLLQVFLDHRLEVVRRRTEFRLTKAQERLHLVEGLLIAILDIDEVIQVIRSSDDAAMAKERLMSIFDLTDVQATYILDMPLRRLTKFSRLELESERDELTERIATLTEILTNEERLRTTVDGELAELAETYSTPRRTVLLADAGASAPASGSLEIPDVACTVLLSATGLVARTASDEPLPESDKRSPHDTIRVAVSSSARSHLAVFTSTGRVVNLDVVDLPTLPATTHGYSLKGTVNLHDFLHMPADEQVVGLAPYGATVLLATAAGRVKRLELGQPAKGEMVAITLEKGDALVGAAAVSEVDDMVLVTAAGQLLRAGADTVPLQGAGARGVGGMKTKDSRVVGGFVAHDGDLVVTVAGSGSKASSMKVTPLSAFPRTGRDGVGVRCHRLLAAEDGIVAAWVAAVPRACTPGGKPVPLPESDDRRDGSGVKTPATSVVLGSTGTDRPQPETGTLFP